MNRPFVTALVCLGLSLSFATGAGASITGIYELGPASISGTNASFDLSLDFSTDSPDVGREVFWFAVDVAMSDSRLTNSGADFSAFSFTKTSPLLDDWAQIAFFGLGESSFSAEFDVPSASPSSLAAGSYLLGTLSVDFSGISVGSVLTVSVVSDDPVIGTEFPGNPPPPPPPFLLSEVTYDPRSQTFVVPGDAGVIPEPASVVIWSLLCAACLGYGLCRRRSA